jgi:hypothetical protein
MNTLKDLQNILIYIERIKMTRMNTYYYEREEMNTNGVAFTFARSDSVDAEVSVNKGTQVYIN